MLNEIYEKSGRKKFIDLTSKIFGLYQVLSLSHIIKKEFIDKNGRKKRSYRTVWLVSCTKCGTEKKMEVSNLRKFNKTCKKCGAGKRIGLNNPVVKDLTGKRFGKLIVLSYAGSFDGDSRNHISKWNCLCDCGKEKIVRACGLLNGSAYSCGCGTIKKRTGKRNVNWRGGQFISGVRWGIIKNGAEKRNIPFLISLQDVETLYEKQNRRCSLTNLPISFGETYLKREDRTSTASIDRIDSELGYTKENIQIVHKDLNFMKQDYTQDHFIEMCKLVAKNN